MLHALTQDKEHHDGADPQDRYHSTHVAEGAQVEGTRLKPLATQCELHENREAIRNVQPDGGYGGKSSEGHGAAQELQRVWGNTGGKLVSLNPFLLFPSRAPSLTGSPMRKATTTESQTALTGTPVLGWDCFHRKDPGMAPSRAKA